MKKVFHYYTNDQYHIISINKRKRNRSIFDKCRREFCDSLKKEYNYSFKQKQIHHIIPIFMNGPNKIWNLIPVTDTQHNRIHQVFDNFFKMSELIQMVSSDC